MENSASPKGRKSLENRIKRVMAPLISCNSEMYGHATFLAKLTIAREINSNLLTVSIPYFTDLWSSAVQ